ncbi:Protein CBG06525 [Caenorhabditis briggsae]|uniref:Protein CBG06525 n=1 Tax=Caenorhabditis briggsae TaxID=6238 RepID=A8X2F6_CAEBR|nr:Protein CBG06525 [Caenorhabditis briggsae]CAP26816.2 Protein CBG06525 [Caenorhabditis briggsae]
MKISTIEQAAIIFPSFQNLDFLFELFVFLEEHITKFIDIEFYIAFFGIFLTIFHVFILTRKSVMMSSISSIMIGIGICDIISMVLAISVRHMIYNFKRDECTPPLTLFTYRLFWVLMHSRDAAIRCSTWLGVLMALIRFLALRFVSRPSFQKISQISFGFHATATCFVVSSIMSFVNSMRTKIIEIGVWKPGESCLQKPLETFMLHELRVSDAFSANNGIILRIVTFVNGISSRIFPCIILPILTILLILEIRRTRVKMTSFSSFSVRKRTERTTGLVILMAVTFFVASLPAGIFTLFQVIYTDIGFVHLSTFVDHFCNAILTLNASMHCLICFTMSSDYRKRVLNILRIRKKEMSTVNSVFSFFFDF